MLHGFVFAKNHYTERKIKHCCQIPLHSIHKAIYTFHAGVNMIRLLYHIYTYIYIQRHFENE